MPYIEPNFNFPALKDAQSKLDEARKRMRTVFDEAGPEMDMSKVKSISGSAEEKVDQIRKDNEELVVLKGKVDGLQAVARAAAEVKDEHTESGDGAHVKDRLPEVKGLGELFVESKAFQTKGASSTLNVELKTLMMRSAGWPPESIRSGRVELTPQARAQNVIDYIPHGTTTQQLYKYMEETTFASYQNDGVTLTADSLASMTSEGQQFGEAQLALTERSKSVEKVTVWIPVTDEQLEDEAGTRDYIQQRLFYMLQKKIDNQCMVGSGSTPQILGTENVSGIQTQALGTDSILDAVYKLFVSIQTNGFAEPSVVFIHPSKWQSVMLLKTADGQYIWGHPSAVGPQRVWGVPVVQSYSHTTTKAVTGDYQNYSMLFSRRGIDVQTTNSHSTHFIEGKQAIRVDARLVLVHFRPKAFGVLTGL